MSSSSTKHHHKSKRHRDRGRSRSRSRSRSRTPPLEKYNSRNIKVKHIKTEKVSPIREMDKERSPSDRHSGSHRHNRSHHSHHRSHRHDRDVDRYKHDRERNEKRRIDNRKKRGAEEDVSGFEYGKPEVKKEPEVEEDKAKPDYGLSGKLADDTNTFRGIVVKYNEPPEARKPKLKWRLYPFKGDTALPVLHVHRQSGYLLGRDRKVADIPIDHPSCSKQHAVLQFRSVEYTRDDGTKGRHTRPYIIDLGSANGTFINNKAIEAQRYVELREKDTIKFGYSSRDFVILHDNTQVSPSSSDAEG